MTNNNWDVVIIGGGAAGLSAALVLSRARRRVVVIDAGAQRNLPAAHMHGFLSRDGFPPDELVTVGREEVTNYGGEFVNGEAVSAQRVDTQRFAVTLDNGSVLHSRRLIVASGVVDHLPAIIGLQERWGKDLLHCPYCHGWEVQERRIAVIGG